MVTVLKQIEKQEVAVRAARAEIEKGEAVLLKKEKIIEKFKAVPRFTRTERRQFTRTQLRRHVQERKLVKRTARQRFLEEKARFTSEVSPIRSQISVAETQIKKMREFEYGRKIYWSGAYYKAPQVWKYLSRMEKKGFRFAQARRREFDFPRITLGEFTFRLPKKEWYEIKGKEITQQKTGELIKRYAPKKYPTYVSKRIDTLTGGRVRISPSAISRFQRRGTGFLWQGKRLSPLPLEYALGSNVVKASRASTILPTTKSMPLEFNQSLFKVGKTRDPKTWMNLDPTIALPLIKKVGIQKMSEVKLKPYQEKAREKLKEFRMKVIAPPVEKYIAKPFARIEKRIYAQFHGTKKEREIRAAELVSGFKRLPKRPSRRETITSLPSVEYMPRQDITPKEILRRYPRVGGAALMAKEQRIESKRLEGIGKLKEKQLKESPYVKGLIKKTEEGIISEPELQTLYQKEFEKRMGADIKASQKRLEVKAKAYQEMAILPAFKKDIPVILTIGIPLGLIGAAIPPLGYATAGAFGLMAVTKPVAQYKMMLQKPLVTAGYIGAWSLAGGVGAGIAKGIGVAGAVKPFTPKIYPKVKPKLPTPTYIAEKMGRRAQITQVYPIWKGTKEIPFMKGLRKIPIVRKLKPAKVITISKPQIRRAILDLKVGKKGVITGEVAYFRDIKRAPPRALLELPKRTAVTFGRLYGKQIVTKGLKGKIQLLQDISRRLSERGIAEQVSGRGKTIIEFKGQPQLKRTIGFIQVEKLYRITPKGKKGARLTMFRPRSPERAVIVAKSVKAKYTPTTFEELGIQRVGKRFPLGLEKQWAVKELTYMKGITVKGKLPKTFEIVPKAKIKVPEKFKITEVVVPKKVGIVKFPFKIKKLSVFPIGKKAQVRLALESKKPASQVTRPPIVARPLRVKGLDITGLKFAELKSRFPTIAPLGTAGASLLFPTRYALPATKVGLTVFPLLRTRVEERVKLKPITKPLIKPVEVGILGVGLTAGIISRQPQLPRLRTVLIPKLGSELGKSLITPQITLPSILRPLTKSPIILLPTIKPVDVTPVIKKKRERYVEAYRVYVIKRGRKVFLAGKYQRGEAIKRGARVARETIVATFGIQQKGQIKAKTRAPSFIPDPRFFRAYRIKEGIRVPLKDVWIEKAPQRLKTRAEVAAVIRGQRRKRRQKRQGGRGIRWF